MRRTHRQVLLFAALAGFLIAAIAIRAQNTSGSLVGHVKDPSGAAVVAAKVTVTNVGTHELRTEATNGAGDYTVPLLSPGTYDLTVSAAGFQLEKETGIELNVDQTVRTDISLAVGSANATVTVGANALTLDTDTGSVQEVISSEQISELPLNGRNFQDLMFLAPGAVNNPGGEQTSYRIAISGSGVSSVSLGGSRGSSEGYTVDGTSILDIGYDTPAFAPSLDDISEFNELTKSYSAAYGYSMNQINLISKSGTDSFHGSAFEFLRNSAVDAYAHGFQSGTNAPVLQQNQFGYSLGGPVRIPWLYNGRGKTFFFANYEGFRLNEAGQSIGSVPQADEMKGKFDANVLGNFTSAQLGSAAGTLTQCGHTYHVGDPHPLFNPFDPNGCPFPVAADGSYTIPSGNLSSLGTLLTRPGLYYPAAPNIAAPPALNVNNYKYSSGTTLNYDQQNYRVDQNIGSKDSIFAHITWHDESELAGGITPINATSTLQPSRLYTTTETHVFSSNFTNQVRVGYTHAEWLQGPQVTVPASDIPTLKWPNAFDAPGMGYPRVEYDTSNLGDTWTYGGGGPFVGSDSTFRSQNWDYGESAIWTVKRHTLSFGLGMRNFRYNMNNGVSYGRFDYNGEESGDNFADSLLGAAVQLSISETGPLSDPHQAPAAHIHLNWWAPYVQDDWKVNDKLTLNLGLRYEYIETPFEEQNNFVWPDFNAPGGAEYIANAKIAATYGGVNPFAPSTGLYVPSPGGERGPGPADKDDFAPRIGFAYRIGGSDKTVLRGGFGKYFDTIEANEYQASSVGIYPSTSGVSTGTDVGQSYPNQFNTNALPSASPGTAALQGNYQPATPSVINPLSNLNFVQIQPSHTLNPYYLAWTVGVERELPWATKLEVDYVGNHGTDLFSRFNPNAPVQCIAINSCIVSTTTPATVPLELRYPHQNFGFMIDAGFNGFSNYNAGDVKVEHRARDLDLIVAYTWSKALDTKSGVAGFSGDDAGWAGPQDGHSISSDYGRSNFDVRQRLAISALYPLPIGKGKALLGDSPRAVDEVIGGWKIGVISSFQGGLPFTVGATDIQGANQTDSERANINPTPGGFHKSLNTWFKYDSTPGSTDEQFTQPAPGYFGDSRRDALSMPGQINADLSLAKSFSIFEKSAFEFRFDAFNAFNHWNPGQPTTVAEAAPNSNIVDGYIAPNDTQGCALGAGAAPGCTAARILQISGRFTF